jgi:CheY-like chemotaxis protein
VRKLCHSILSNHGYTVLECADAKCAMEICEKPAFHFDLLLTDVIMPEMSGIELAEILRMRNCDFKVLFISGYDKPSTRSTEADASLLMKPFTPAELLTKVQEVMMQPKTA